MASSRFDAIQLLQDLIRCPSVTPEHAGTLDILQTHLQAGGFTCHRMVFSDPNHASTDNLYARFGHQPPHFCFAGHVDVVPSGLETAWRHPPFSGHIDDQDVIFGRGAVDMKGSIAAFMSAALHFISENSSKDKGSISFLITADEEGIAINGTQKVLKWLEKRHEKIDFCLVGEPICQQYLGDTIKIGRRGSLNTVLDVEGVQGHVAYPERADNPIPKLLRCLQVINQGPPEDLSPAFTPSHVEITSIDVDNPTVNIIPQHVQAKFNIRFNDRHQGHDLQKWIQSVCQTHCGDSFQLTFQLSGEAEFLESNVFTNLLSDAIFEITGCIPQPSTAGGTSDARFIRNYAPVLEFGLVGQTMHQVNERVATNDILTLTEIYTLILEKFFK